MNDSYLKAITGDIQNVLNDMRKVFGLPLTNTTLGSGNSSCGKVKVRLPGVYEYKVKVANLKKRLKKHRSNA
jgi:hypothetical protein